MENDEYSQNYEPSEEDFLPDPEQGRIPGPLLGRPGYQGLLIVAAVYFLIVTMSGVYWTNASARVLAVSYKSSVIEGHWWQLFSAIFVHGDFMHLLSNTPMYIVFGLLLRGYYGSWVFPFICVVVGALANLFTVSMMDETRRLVGMSGMIYAMVAMWMMIYVRYETRYGLAMRFFRASAVSIALMFPTSYAPNVSYLAHGWGFVLGAVAGLLIGKFAVPKSSAIAEARIDD